MGFSRDIHVSRLNPNKKLEEENKKLREQLKVAYAEIYKKFQLTRNLLFNNRASLWNNTFKEIWISMFKFRRDCEGLSLKKRADQYNKGINL